MMEIPEATPSNWRTLTVPPVTAPTCPRSVGAIMPWLRPEAWTRSVEEQGLQMLAWIAKRKRSVRKVQSRPGEIDPAHLSPVSPNSLLELAPNLCSVVRQVRPIAHAYR